MASATLSAQTDPWAAHYASPDGYRWWPSEELVRAVGGRYLGDVLEVGCGNGANLWFLAERTAGRVVGLDGNVEAIRAADEHMDRRGSLVELLRGDIFALPFADGSFDSLVDCMVSQHVPWDRHPALYAEYRRVLRPGGWLFLYHLTDRTTGGQTRRPDHDRLALFPAAGLTCLPNRWALGAVVQDAGFVNVMVAGMAREYPAGDVAHYAVVTGTAA